VRDQLGPLDAGLDPDVPFVPVQVQDALEPLHVEEKGIRSELLAAHRVASAGDTHGPPFPLGVAQGRLDRVDGQRLDNPVHARSV
jgi:hypothetical protein